MDVAKEGVMRATSPPEDIRVVLERIRNAEASQATREDWRDSYACYLWQDPKVSPPNWVSVFADETICPCWNTVAGCGQGSLCGFVQQCAVCRKPDHGTLDTNADGEWVCPTTRILAAYGHDVKDRTALVSSKHE